MIIQSHNKISRFYRKMCKKGNWKKYDQISKWLQLIVSSKRNKKVTIQAINEYLLCGNQGRD